MRAFAENCSGVRSRWVIFTWPGWKRGLLCAGDFKGHPDAALLVMYSDALAHLIYAAADVVLVPSMFEPCGLTQLIAMRCASEAKTIAQHLRPIDACHGWVAVFVVRLLCAVCLLGCTASTGAPQYRLQIVHM